MLKAKLIKDNLKNFKGHAALYKLSEPLIYQSWLDKTAKHYEYVICSTSYNSLGELQTLIFGANQKGEVVDWGDLPGSMRNSTSHEEVLNNAGYELEKISN